jgi:hypothetical protein
MRVSLSSKLCLSMCQATVKQNYEDLLLYAIREHSEAYSQARSGNHHRWLTVVRWLLHTSGAVAAVIGPSGMQRLLCIKTIPFADELLAAGVSPLWQQLTAAMRSGHSMYPWLHAAQSWHFGLGRLQLPGIPKLALAAAERSLCCLDVVLRVYEEQLSQAELVDILYAAISLTPKWDMADQLLNFLVNGPQQKCCLQERNQHQQMWQWHKMQLAALRQVDHATAQELLQLALQRGRCHVACILQDRLGWLPLPGAAIVDILVNNWSYCDSDLLEAAQAALQLNAVDVLQLLQVAVQHNYSFVVSQLSARHASSQRAQHRAAGRASNSSSAAPLCQQEDDSHAVEI